MVTQQEYNKQKKEDDFIKKIKAGLLIALSIIIVIALFSVFVSIPAGNKGIVLQFGAPINTWDAGLHFKIPFVQDVQLMNIQTQKDEVKSASASSDLQDVSTTTALNYKINADSALSVYRDIGMDYADKVISPAIQESVKSITAKYTAEELITKRQDVKDKIDTAITARLAPYGITVQTISITNFEFSQQFTSAIEAKVTAQQQALKADNDLQRIKIEAEQKVATATADAQAVQLNAQAQADALRLANEQLTNSPLALQLQWIQKWDGHLPSVMSSGSNGLLLNVDPASMTK